MKRARIWFYAIAGLLSVLILVIFSPRAFENPSVSMMPTLAMNEDFLIFPGLALFGLEIDRWDLVVFKYPVSPDVTFVKRVVGLPGDKIEWKNGLFINDKPVARKNLDVPPPEIPAREDGLGPPGGYGELSLVEESFEGFRLTVLDEKSNDEIVAAVQVPEGHFYVAGDFRSQSHDSRRWGFLPAANVIGKVYRYPWNSPRR
ncbi:MAG: signal peptidase I [Bdellovibrionota bacterium]